MKIAIVADVHIKTSRDLQYIKLINSLKSLDKECTDLFFLGDIFDLMVGASCKYFIKYSDFWDTLEKIIRSGIKIHYFEGNHDFHLQKLFTTFCTARSISFNQLLIYKNNTTINSHGKTIFFAHGDTIEKRGLAKKVYQYLLKCRLMYLFSNYVFPNFLIHFLGRTISRIAKFFYKKQWNLKDPNELQKLKIIFREHYEEFSKKNITFDEIVCAHTHLEDEFQTSLGVDVKNVGAFLIHEKVKYFEIKFQDRTS